ncbi:MAG TPA: JAB domain-containing protein [Candidatus Eisenbacteria bacterium]|nr:JAB domain-containing protein [Candidatus Eisenbacteria bacterium]
MRYNPAEFKVTRVRECPLADEPPLIDTPERASVFWREHIVKSDWFDPEKEAFCVLLLNARRRIKGFNLVSLGNLDTVTVHPREVFRPAIVAVASAIVLMHNHPSGDPTPSEADTKVTRDLIRAGQLMKIEVLDHVIVGQKYCSLRESGYFL